MSTVKGSPHTSSELGADTYWYIKSNARLITTLPEPSEQWQVNELENAAEIAPILSNLHWLGIVTKVDHGFGEAANERVAIWRTNRKAIELAKSCVEDEKRRSPFECGHNHILNEEGVEGITCGVCGSVYDRSEVDL